MMRATTWWLTGTGADDGGAEVEAVACEVGDPAGLEGDEALDEDEEGVCVKGLQHMARRSVAWRQPLGEE